MTTINVSLCANGAGETTKDGLDVDQIVDQMMMDDSEICSGILHAHGSRITEDSLYRTYSKVSSLMSSGISSKVSSNATVVVDFLVTKEDTILLPSGTEISKSSFMDPGSPYQITSHVEKVVSRWSKVSPIPPDQFLLRLLSSRGYDTSLIPALESDFRRPPTIQQIKDYDIAMVGAVRNSDLDALKILHDSGRCMSACNQYSESIVHMACRRSEFKIVEYVLNNGGDFTIIDDFGRTPLHDACWCPEPRFDVVTLLLDRNPELLRVIDVRGSNPLNYVRQKHWLQWCAYIFYMKEKYWSVASTEYNACLKRKIDAPQSHAE
jgi:hypothetical protein